ncbi:MAG: fatty acid hydroxylase family protein, partial [Gammaproteobacteria bacterium]
MTRDFSGPLTEMSAEVMALLAAHLPRDLRWPMLLLMLVLASAIWWLRDGHGARGADGRVRRAGL